jgi:hypothetical protein
MADLDLRGCRPTAPDEIEEQCDSGVFDLVRSRRIDDDGTVRVGDEYRWAERQIGAAV